MNEETQPSFAEQTPPTYVMPSVALTEGLLQQQIDSSLIVDEIENALLGKKVIMKNNVPTVSDPDPNLGLINETGMARLSMELRARINKIFQLSIMDERDIEEITIAFGKNINRAIFEHWDAWNIKSVSAASQISSILVDTVYSTLKKAYLGRYLRSISTTQSMQEIQHLQPQQEQQRKTGINNIPMIGKLFGK